ncbi:hypothetical protein N8580_01610 [Akkermansiaceae bacterium]|nr:hypothetical protein [Akkermansiaceae bacterium]
MSFKRLDPEDFLISADSVTAGAWTNNNPTITTFYSSSTQEGGASGNYYLDVYSEDPDTSNTASVEFAIAFADSEGSGSLLYDPGIVGKSPTATVYGQYQNVVLGDEINNFNFGGITPTTQSFYALTIERAKYKGSIFPGTLNLHLTTPGGGDTVVLTDNSNDVSTVSFNEAGRVFQLISGSNGSAVEAADTPSNAVSNGMTVSGSYGLFLPDIGTLILNASALDLGASNGGISLGTEYDENTANNNNRKFIESLEEGASFTLNSQENITSDFVFVRARNSEYNYSENPSFISGSTGEVLYTSFINSPQTFITSVGLYNDSNELLAVAKLSKPLKKDFTKEALIRIKLDF